MPQDILNLLVFIEDYVYYAGLSRKVFSELKYHFPTIHNKYHLICHMLM